jgi:hypothetical protein
MDFRLKRQARAARQLPLCGPWRAVRGSSSSTEITERDEHLGDEATFWDWFAR